MYGLLTTTKLRQKRFNPMKGSYCMFLAVIFFLSCGDRKSQKPDISNIAVKAEIQRFDRDYFAQDSNHLPEGLLKLQQQYPVFINDFTANILGAGIIGDSNKVLPVANRHFFTSYAAAYDQVKGRFSDLSATERSLQQAFQYVKAYFPAYKVPVFISYFGPFDGPGAAITENAIVIGLHLYAGADYPYYTSPEGQQLYPTYISRRFDKAYIPVNCIKAVEEDLFPDKSQGMALVDQMIEKGKYWWLAKQFLPDSPDSLITGFSKEQLDWCESNEGIIWNLMLQNDQIYTTDPSMIQNFIGEAPGTQGFPPAAPGNLGQWIGMKIVETYIDKNKATTPGQLMLLKPRTILESAKYKPR
ncbi:hypothetical protein [Flavihumibacter petaseus]|uniref:Gliding motility-associated lipoprotein GldB n=1 Tax=Flavihumibacter petaseus NBRC 106054 TaxID=1220578 RepID=A0A0E9MVV1_9BACT|nr:hypothetical protein [Flavihumibacter petaseus]GAO41719.1 hypothetical protein FPE01S_01_07330 [Flavihumibacter petaseus NBRC 106054]